MLSHFIQEIWASMDSVILRISWNQTKRYWVSLSLCFTFCKMGRWSYYENQVQRCMCLLCLTHGQCSSEAGASFIHKRHGVFLLSIVVPLVNLLEPTCLPLVDPHCFWNKNPQKGKKKNTDGICFLPSSSFHMRATIVPSCRASPFPLQHSGPSPRFLPPQIFFSLSPLLTCPSYKANKLKILISVAC